MRHAAVAVVVTREPEPALLFVKRQERVGDPWSGHMAFPGGFQAAGETPEETARRETEEETGLPLARIGEPLGRLDEVFPRSVYLPRVVVTPVVFTVHGRPPVEARAEVDQAVWLPASAIFAQENRQPLVLDLPAGQRTFDSITVGGFVIWGLTERVLAQLHNII